MANLDIANALQNERDQLRERLKKERENSNQQLHNEGTANVANIQETGATERTGMTIEDAQTRQQREIDFKTPERDANVRSKNNETDFAQKYQDDFAKKKLTAMDLTNEGTRKANTGADIANRRNSQLGDVEKVEGAVKVLDFSKSKVDKTQSLFNSGYNVGTDSSNQFDQANAPVFNKNYPALDQSVAKPTTPLSDKLLPPVGTSTIDHHSTTVPGVDFSSGMKKKKNPWVNP